MDSRAFYDDYVTRQMRVGVNRRHRSIVAYLRRFGMAPGARVLEIGCGVGTVTGLIAEVVGPAGSVTAVDLSPKSIEAAQELLGHLRHVTFVAGDILELPLEGPFDVVVLPDVIEHIPLEVHPALFERVARWVAGDGFVLLHYPDPHWLAWCHEHRPDLLQLVDQPVYLDRLAADVHPTGLAVVYLESYGIWVREGDYQVAVLRPVAPDRSYEVVEDKPSFLQRIRNRLAR